MVDGDDAQDPVAPASDRVLVRPYIKQTMPPEGPADPPTREMPTIGESGTDGEPGATVAPSAEEVPDQVAEERERRTVLWLVGAALVLSLAAAGLVVAIWPGGDDEPVPVAAPHGSPVRSAAADPSPRAAASPSAPSVTSSSSPRPSRSPSASPSPSAVPSAQAATPATTTIAPPAADRVGPVTGPGGHCLDVEGGIALFGYALSVYDCNGDSSQRWTVASDGTLRTIGQCATAVDNSRVELAACGTSDSAQWRAGSGKTLVNVSTGRCLSDPDNGAKTGISLRLAECGGSGQSWALP